MENVGFEIEGNVYDDTEDTLQGNCKDIAGSSQTPCRDNADSSQTPCKGIADNSQTNCKDTPMSPKRGALPVLNPALIKFLANDKMFQKCSYDNYQSVEDCAENQLGAPMYCTKYLNELGFNVNTDSLTRYYFPAARVERQKLQTESEKKKVKLWQKIAAGFALFWVIAIWSSPKEEDHYPTSDAAGETKTDSSITWNQLHRLVTEYNKYSVTKIYPAYSYPQILQRLNDGKTYSAKEIKQVLDERRKLIEKNQKK